MIHTDGVFVLVKSSGGSKKKLSAYNKFMRTEMARLKEDDPEITHKERCVHARAHKVVPWWRGELTEHVRSPRRFSKATANWKTAKENPKA